MIDGIEVVEVVAVVAVVEVVETMHRMQCKLAMERASKSPKSDGPIASRSDRRLSPASAHAQELRTDRKEVHSDREKLFRVYFPITPASIAPFSIPPKPSPPQSALFEQHSVTLCQLCPPSDNS